MAAFLPEDFGEPESPAPSASFKSISSPALFGDLPNTDALTALFQRQGIPHQPDDAQWHVRSVEEMRQTGSWRGLARYAEASIRGSTHDDPKETLELWRLRCEALQHLALYDLLVQELSSLFSVLPPAVSLSEAPHVSPLIPFDLILTHASLHGLLGTPAPSIDALFELLQACKMEFKRSQGTETQLWQERIRRVGLSIFGFLLDDKAYDAAISLARQFCTSFPGDTQIQRSLQSAQIMVGDIKAARETFNSMSEVQQEQLPGILQAMAENEWSRALELAAALANKTQTLSNQNNLATLHLVQGNLKEAHTKLAQLPTQDPRAFFNSPAMISNLTAILELVQSSHTGETGNGQQSTLPQWTKKRLLQEAAEYIADGARADVFKL